MSKEDEEYKKLYNLLSSLSSKTAPRTDRHVTPMISLMTEKQKSITLTLDIPPMEPIIKKTSLVQVETPLVLEQPHLVQVETPLVLEQPPLVQVETPLVLEQPPLVQVETPLVLEQPPLVQVEPIQTMKEMTSLEEIMSKSSTRSGITPTCEACLRTFPTYSNLLTHHKITPMCTQWLSLPDRKEYHHNPPSIHIFMDDILAETVAVDGSPTECRFCHGTFSTKGNLHKHFHTSIVCNRMAHIRFKKVVANLK